jgi:hypothetical protein
VKTFASVALLFALGASGAYFTQQQGFPHAEHENLFPLCEGCHLGVEAGDSAAFYPEPALCGRCHDGEQADRVDWRGPTREIDNVRFDHAHHAREVARDGEPLACESCHAEAGAEWMHVDKALAGNCLSCHAHEATEHFADAECSTCHVPLAQTAFAAERVLELPIPPSHQQDDFLAQGHGTLAEPEVAGCSTCHTRERCTSCHVNAASVATIAAIPPAPPTMSVPRWTASYPVPASHLSPSWTEKHGPSASVASCSTCHTREDCETCHRASQSRVVADLARRRDVEAPGVVGMVLVAPSSHAAPSFVRAHGTLAATSVSSCMMCHTPDSCAECHDRTALADVFPPYASGDAMSAGDATRREASASVADTVRRVRRFANRDSRFHPPTFLLRHSSSAYGRRLECANCHDVRVFCRDCHTQSGLSTAGGTGRLQGAFHDAEPAWLLRHARAARQGLESCTACHTQRDCLQCHSQLGAFRINPHGDGFDARRAQQRNAVICFACHLADPLEGRM